jgi:hypothetical protein
VIVIDNGIFENIGGRRPIRRSAPISPRLAEGAGCLDYSVRGRGQPVGQDHAQTMKPMMVCWQLPARMPGTFASLIAET